MATLAMATLFEGAFEPGEGDARRGKAGGSGRSGGRPRAGPLRMFSVQKTVFSVPTAQTTFRFEHGLNAPGEHVVVRLKTGEPPSAPRLVVACDEVLPRRVQTVFRSERCRERTVNSEQMFMNMRTMFTANPGGEQREVR